MADDYFATNRRTWDERAQIHWRDSTGFYDIDALRRGDNRLLPIEDRELGDVKGRRLAHLQCHFGLDTLALARQGAEATGLDFSPVAIANARSLARELGIAATFVEGNVYDARSLVDGTFDIVLSSWGAIPWLPDIRRWAKVVASLLARGGYVYLAEGHPSLSMLDERDPGLRPGYDFRTPPDAPIATDDETTYTGDTTQLVHRRNYNWIHPLSDVIMAMLEAELRLVFVHEHEELPWPFAPFFEEIAESPGMYRLPKGHPRLPLSFSIKAIRD